jgi:hypothetical protein
MKMVKSLLLGTAAGLVAMTGAQAADLPVKAKPVQYVKICSLYGAGFYYIPGTDTCIKIGGFARAEVNFNAQGSFGALNGVDFNSSNNSQNYTMRSRFGVTFDTRSQTEYGTLRSYAIIASTSTNSQAGGGGAANGLGQGNQAGAIPSAPYTRLWSNAAFIQFAGFTAGKTGGFFDFDTQGYSNQSNVLSSTSAGSGVDLFAYTAQLGNGLSASISVENAAIHRTAVTSVATGTNAVGVGSVANPATVWQYGNQQMPDIVGNLRIDQAWGSAQIMGAYHQINASNTGTQAETLTANAYGYGLGAGLKVNLPMLGKGDYIITQVNYGKGAMSYPAGGNGTGFILSSNNGAVNHLAPTYDAVFVNGGLDLAKAWSITGGFEHYWVPTLKTSLYGAYGKETYSAAASAVLAPANALAGSSANWAYTQIGSRTVWTPVTNLDLSVEVMYNKLNTAFATGTAVYADKSWYSGIFRVQRNFYP